MHALTAQKKQGAVPIDESKLPRIYKVEKDSPFRSLAKTISWRILATLTTFLISWLITQDYGLALAIGGIEAVVKLFAYYLHERAWTNVKWGKTWNKNQMVRAVKLRYLIYIRSRRAARRA